VIFKTRVLKSYINYLWPQGQHHFPKEKFWVRLKLLLLMNAVKYEAGRWDVFK